MASLTQQGKEAELPCTRCQPQSREAAGSQHAATAREGTSFKNKRHQPRLPLPITLSHESV